MRKANAGAFKLRRRVQAVEGLKEVLRVLTVKADAVVGKAEDPLRRGFTATDCDFSARTRARVLERVGYEIADDQAEHRRITRNRGERAARPADIAAFGFKGATGNCVFDQLRHIDRLAHHRRLAEL